MKRRGVRVVPQKHDWDCGAACLAMLLDRPYGDVAAVVREQIAARRRGLTIGDLQRVAGAFDVALEARRKRRGYLDGQTGILGILGGDAEPWGHWVVVKSGAAIVDPSDARVWAVDDYMAAHGSRPVTLLVEAH